MQLAALAQLGAGYQSSDGRRFDDLGMADEYQEEVTILDPIAIPPAGQRDNEFGEFPAGSMSQASWVPRAELTSAHTPVQPAAALFEAAVLVVIRSG